MKGVGEEYPLPSESAPFSESLKAAKLLEDVTRDEFHNIENMFKLQVMALNGFFYDDLFISFLVYDF